MNSYYGKLSDRHVNFSGIEINKIKELDICVSMYPAYPDQSLGSKCEYVGITKNDYVVNKDV